MGTENDGNGQLFDIQSKNVNGRSILYYNLLKKRERRVEKLMREKNEKENKIWSVNDKIGQADTYPKISRERKYDTTEMLTKR